MSFLTNLLDRCAEKPSVPLMLIGDPGNGKTAMVEAWAKAHQYPLVKLLVSTLDETDVAGIVVREGENARTLAPNWINQLKDRGILFLDEFNTGRKEVVDTLLTLICSRHLPNGEKLGEGVIIIAAMNDAAQCDNYELSPAMKNRFMQVEHHLSEKQWLQYFTTGAIELKNIKPLGDFETLDQWHERFTSNDKIEADKKALVQDAIAKGLKFDKGDEFQDKDTATSPRSLLHLAYWCRSAQEMQKWAGAFISEEGVATLRAVTVEAVNDNANAVFGGGSKNAGAKESSKLQGSAGIHGRIQSAVNP